MWRRRRDVVAAFATESYRASSESTFVDSGHRSLLIPNGPWLERPDRNATEGALTTMATVRGFVSPTPACNHSRPGGCTSNP